MTIHTPSYALSCFRAFRVRNDAISAMLQILNFSVSFRLLVRIAMFDTGRYLAAAIPGVAREACCDFFVANPKLFMLFRLRARNAHFDTDRYLVVVVAVRFALGMCCDFCFVASPQLRILPRLFTRSANFDTNRYLVAVIAGCFSLGVLRFLSCYKSYYARFVSILCTKCKV